MRAQQRLLFYKSKKYLNFKYIHDYAYLYSKYK